MIVKLSLGDVERARLVLRGGSVLDMRRLNVKSIDACNQLLRINGFDLNDERDQLRLGEIRRASMDYLIRNLGFTFTPAILETESVSELMLLAGCKDLALRRQACTLLKIMHVEHFIEAKELKSRLNISDRALYHLVEEKVARIVGQMRDQGYPIVNFQSSRKTHDSIITKLISKRQGNRALLYDMIRFRIITATVEEILPVVAYLSEHLFPFHFVVPGESENSIFDFKDFIRRHPRISRLARELEVDLMYDEDTPEASNPETSSMFRTAKFVTDLPLRLDDRQMEVWAPGLSLPTRIVHVPSEFQIVDEATNIRNEKGDASHRRYKARKVERVRERLLRGMTARNGKDKG